MESMWYGSCTISSLSCHYSLFKCNWRNKSISGKGQDTRREMVPYSLAFCRFFFFRPCFVPVACPCGLVIYCAY